MLGYLTIPPPSPGPLFLCEDGSTLSRPRLVQALHQALRAARVVESQFSGHSLRIGYATMAAHAGLPDSMIKTLGHWKLSTFTLYIRTPLQELSASSMALASSHGPSPIVAQPSTSWPQCTGPMSHYFSVPPTACTVPVLHSIVSLLVMLVHVFGI